MINQYFTEQGENCIIHCRRNTKVKTTINRKKNQERNKGMKCQLMIGISRDRTINQRYAHKECYKMIAMSLTIGCTEEQTEE